MRNVFFSFPKTEENSPQTRADGSTTHLSLFPFVFYFFSFCSLPANANCLFDGINIKGRDRERKEHERGDAEGAADHLLMELRRWSPQCLN